MKEKELDIGEITEKFINHSDKKNLVEDLKNFAKKLNK